MIQELTSGATVVCLELAKLFFFFNTLFDKKNRLISFKFLGIFVFLKQDIYNPFRSRCTNRLTRKRAAKDAIKMICTVHRTAAFMLH